MSRSQGLQNPERLAIAAKLQRETCEVWNHRFVQVEVEPFVIESRCVHCWDKQDG